MKKNEVKACPFCGSENLKCVSIWRTQSEPNHPIIQKEGLLNWSFMKETENAEKEAHAMACLDCNAIGPYKLKRNGYIRSDEAFDLWNNRK